MSQFQHLLEGIVDEDEAYETGEALLGEPGEVLDQEAGIGGHQDQAVERRPQADPQAELQIIEVVVPARSSKTGAPNQWESCSVHAAVLTKSASSMNVKVLLRTQKTITLAT